MDKCDFGLVKKIYETDEVKNIGEQEIIVKAVPDCEGTGLLDKREFFIRSAIYAFQKSMPTKFSIEGMRTTTKTYCKDMCTKEIAEDSQILWFVIFRFTKSYFNLICIKFNRIILKYCRTV